MSNIMMEEVQKLHQMRKQVLDEARPEAVEAQRKYGKLTARERINLLFDEGTFVELGILGHHQGETELMKPLSTPADGVVVGFGKVDGRMVCCVSYDFTVLGGSMGSVNDAKMARVRKMSLEYGYPLIFFIEGGGARIQERMGSKATKGHDRFFDLSLMSGWVPIVGAIVGPSFAGHANLVGLSDYIPMLKGSTMGMAGPRLVRMATGEKVTNEQLGGSQMHVYETGMADDEFETEEELITAIKQFLNYFPSNAQESPSRKLGSYDLSINDEILDIIPENYYAPYSMHKIISLIVDKDSEFEIKPKFAKNIITMLARINGNPIGILANNPKIYAGTLDSNGSDKMSHFISMCDAFNIPLLYLVDCPGYMVGSKAERSGIVRRSMKPIYELTQATVPKFTVIIRKAYGLAYHTMGAAEFLPDLMVAWPGAEVSPMGSEGAVNVIYGKQLDNSPESEEFRKKMVDEFRRLSQAITAAVEMRMDDLIDPRETRKILADALDVASNRPRYTRHRPPKKHGICPI